MKPGEEFIILRGGIKTALIFIKYYDDGSILAYLKENGKQIEVLPTQIITENQIELL